MSKVSKKIKPVTQLLNGKAIAKYPSITAASQFNKVQPAHIGKVTAGNRNTAGGYSWKTTKTFKERFSPSNAGVSQMDRDGKVLATYVSVDMAAKVSGVTAKGITKVISGKGRIAGGYLWASYGDMKASKATITLIV